MFFRYYVTALIHTFVFYFCAKEPENFYCFWKIQFQGLNQFPRWAKIRKLDGEVFRLMDRKVNFLLKSVKVREILFRVCDCNNFQKSIFKCNLVLGIIINCKHIEWKIIAGFFDEGKFKDLADKFRVNSNFEVTCFTHFKFFFNKNCDENNGDGSYELLNL